MPRGNEILTQESLLERFSYNPVTGTVWNDRGATVGYLSDVGGYKRMRLHVDGKNYVMARLIWLMMTGEWPKGEIDHIDGNPLNNRWDNLRDVSKTENLRNCKTSKNNTSGINGVQVRYVVTIGIGGGKNKQVYNGTDFFEACCRRKSAELKYGYHANHGR